MSRTANLSTLGLYEYDKDLFSLMVLPPALDKEVLINNILAETAELEVLYPNPVVLKNLINVWSRKQVAVWQKLYDTTQYEYNPIENYNRMETGSDNSTGTTTRTGTDTREDTTTRTGSSLTRPDLKNEHKVAAFDSADVVKQSEDDTTGQTTTTYTEQGSNNGNITRQEEMVNSNNGERNIHAHGNIGVTTTQEMIEQERRISRFNLYDVITEEYKRRFCIMVY